MSRIFKIMAAATVAITVVCWAPRATNAAPALYDDFSTAPIDRTKWDQLEFVRRVEAGKLKSELRRFGSRGGNTLNFIDTAGVDAYQVDITVSKLINSQASARARLAGFFYDDGTPGAGNTGEVFASIEVRGQQTNGPSTQLPVFVTVGVCGDANCSNSNFRVILEDGTRFGPVALGETHTYSLAWDEVAEKFTYGFDGATFTFDPTAQAPVAGPSNSSFKGLQTRVTAVGGDPVRGGHIEATFDNVKLISPTKTQSLAGVLLLLLDN